METKMNKKLSDLINIIVIFVIIGTLVCAKPMAKVQADAVNDEYYFLRSWGGEGLMNPRGFDFGLDGTIYIASLDNKIIALNPSLEVFNTWGDYGSEPGNFNEPLDVAVDRMGYVYVSDCLNDRIQKFTSDGDFILEWGSHGSGIGQFFCPDGIAIDANNQIYVADIQNSRIQKFSSTGQYITQWGNQGQGEGEFYHPESVAVDTDGLVYVADTWNSRIEVFSPDGNFIKQWPTNDVDNSLVLGVAVQGNEYVYVFEAYRIKKFTVDGQLLLSWGAYGVGPGLFNSIQGIGINTIGNVLVSDNGVIKVFTNDGVYLTYYGNQSSCPGQFIGSSSSAVDHEGNIFLADTYNHRIQEFSISGTYINSWGSQGSGPGEFILPSDLAIDGNGDVYVTDTFNNRIQVFTSEGVFIRKWGANGTEPGQFQYPHGISVDANYVYVADTENKRVQIFQKNGTFVRLWNCHDPVFNRDNPPQDIAIGSNGHVYTLFGDYVQESTNTGNPIANWGEVGSEPGQFNTAEFITINELGQIFISDGYNHRIQIFDENGGYITSVGSRGNSNGKFTYPKGLAVFSDLLIVVDAGNARMQIFSTTLPEEDPYSGLIQDGSIESSSLNNWTIRGLQPASVSNHAYQGLFSLQLGEPVAQTEQGKNEVRTYQTFFVNPSWARPTLSFKYNMFVNDIMDYSDFLVAIQDGVGLNHLATVIRDGFQPCIRAVAPAPGRNLGWRSVTYDLSAYKGQYIRVVFANRNLWPNSWGIWTYLDDVRVIDAGPLPPRSGRYLSFLPVVNLYRCDAVY